uniref:DHC_N1 domain-containing protein n=1 Tax=Syphacia muris TaxID=451379 RepID=A0A0N5AC29_9BILA
MTKVNNYNLLMKDMPLNELMAATDMNAIRIAVIDIFTHLKKIRNTKYPITRALRFIEAISKDLCSQMLRVLGTRRLMNIPLMEFDELIGQCVDVFAAWSDEYDKLSQLLRELSKKKREEHLKLAWRINPQHKKLEARLEHMRKFRRQHEQLRMVISRVLRPAGTVSDDQKVGENTERSVPSMHAGDLGAIEQVNLAYENVKEVDCLDISSDGSAAWEDAVHRYESMIERVETQITALLRDQLGTAKNADEMFTIFQRFNALFVRSHIRGAIREYQTSLIQRVKEDIDQLQTRFTDFRKESNERNLNTIDIPPLSASIIWLRQIDRRLSQYMKRIEDVLGKGWENHVEGERKFGHRLKLEGENFRKKLNTQPIFEDWIAKVKAKNPSIQERLFAFDKRQKDGKVLLHLKVNFSPDVVTLFKEVRNLKHMGFRVPLNIVNFSHHANLLYPFAMSLLESIRTYDSINERIANKPGISMLIASCRKEIHNQLSEGNLLMWDSYKMDMYAVKFSETISNYQEKVEELEVVLDTIEVNLAALDTCQYSSTTISALLTSIQKAIDQLSLGNYSNLNQWVENIDKQIEKKLAVRVEEAIRLWTLVLTHKDLEEESDDKAALPVLQPIVLEMRVTSQVMYVNPSIDQARAHLLDQLFAWQAVVTDQHRISSKRFQVFIFLFALTKNNESTYRDVLAVLPQGQKILDEAYAAVEDVIKEVSEYVGEWLRYQALWDLQPDLLYERLGFDIKKWMKTLVEVRKTRSTFDTQETTKEIYPIIVDYTKVQSKVSLKLVFMV